MPEYLVYVYDLCRFDRARGEDVRPRYVAYTNYRAAGHCRHVVDAPSGYEAKKLAVRSHKSACVKAAAPAERQPTPKSEAIMTAADWLRIRIEWTDPEKPHEVISLEEADARFGLTARAIAGLRSGAILRLVGGVTRPFPPEVYALHCYTSEDCLRDAAPELLDVLRAVYAWTVSPQGPAVEAAIAKAEGRAR